MIPQSVPHATNGGLLLVLGAGVVLFAVYSLTSPMPDEDPRRTRQLAGPRALVRWATLAGFMLSFLLVLGFTVTL